MGDIDQALARAYGRRGPSDEAAGTNLPAPHFAVAGPPVAPRVPSPAMPHRDLEPVGPESSVTLEWPAIVRALEREHGPRFEQLADALVDARKSVQLRSIFFTSCHRAEGRTTLLLGLARALARRPGRTVLVDADLTGPMLARSLGIVPRFGLDDVLEGSAALADVVLDAADDHLAVVPLRSAMARPREILTSPAWSTALACLRRDFDHVLIDGSPLFASLKSVALPRSVDAAILLHNRTLTGDRAVLRAREALEAGGLPLLGLAETFV